MKPYGPQIKIDKIAQQREREALAQRARTIQHEQNCTWGEALHVALAEQKIESKEA